MCTHYFGLRQKAFTLVRNCDALFLSAQYREALAHLQQGVESEDCFLLLTGDVGMGKSTLCQCLLTVLPENCDVAVVTTPCISVLDLLTTICHALHIRVRGDMQQQDFLQALEDYLVEAKQQGRLVVLLVDEAQNSSLHQLEMLCSLTQFRVDQEQLLKVILIGQSVLSEILNQQDGSKISHYITSRYHLLPLDKRMTQVYVEHRLMVAGAKDRIFSKNALGSVFAYSHGIPRLIDALCSEAMEIASRQNNFLVTADHIEKASEKVLGASVAGTPSPASKPLWKWIVSGLMVLLLVGGTLCWYYWSQRKPLLVLPKTEEMAEKEVGKIHIVPLRIDKRNR